jgi:hypothetical protein
LFLYDHKKLLHETDGADNITKSYVSSTDEEFGDLIGADRIKGDASLNHCTGKGSRRL